MAVKLPSSVARCSCGELLYGNKEKLIKELFSAGDIEEIDVSRYQVDPESIPAATTEREIAPTAEGEPRSIRVVARGANKSINEIYTIDEDPLLIGRMGCHIEIDDAELSIRHCEVARAGNDLVLRDLDSHTGTFVDGEPVSEKVLSDRMHLVRAGGALVCLEPTDEPGVEVEALAIQTEKLLAASPLVMKKLLERGAKEAKEATETRLVLVCTKGPCAGKEFEVPPEGGIVGRKGTVKIPDEYLSRKHFAFFRDEDEGALRIRDLGSSNGTYLNTLPARDTKVQDGDQIRAGYSEFRLEKRPISDEP
ncbi:MAG: FHA domain-containing protein [Thermoanaerobaculia bacterium]|nr:FHA domain-containing protein [Thermoanaerobaculia bacterium]